MTEALLRMSTLEFAAWMLAASLVRYWVIAGLPYFVLYKLRPAFVRSRKVQRAYPAASVVRYEFLWGNFSSVLVAASVVAAFAGWKAGYARLYTDPDRYGTVWYYASILAMAAIHDTWFYWTHRLLHLPVFFKRFHGVHHRSLNPTPWASLSFHPVESVLSFGFFPLMLFVVPFHPVPLAWFFVLMFVGNASGHSGFELGRPSRLKRLFGGALVHNLHHTSVTKNFGLYTNFWDLVCGTFDASYDRAFRALEDRVNEPGGEPGSRRDAPPRAG